jgi:hypothetical protein
MTEMRTLKSNISKVSDEIDVVAMADEIEARAAGSEFESRNQGQRQPSGRRKSDAERLAESYSITRAAKYLSGDVKQSDATAELEVDAMAREVARNCNLPTTGKGILILERSDVATALDAGNLGTTSFMPTIQGYQKQIFAEKLGAKMYMGLTGIQKLPVSDTTAIAGFVAEGGSFGAVAANVRQRTLEPHALLAKSTNGWYLKAHAGPDSDRVLLDNLLKAEINAVNANLIKKIGAGPDGAFDDADITDVSGTNGSALGRAILISLKNAAASNDAGGSRPAFIISPTLQGRLENLAVDAGSGLFVMDPDKPNRLMGYDAHVTTFMPTNLTKGSMSGTGQGAIFGYFDNLVIASWAVRELIVDKASSDAGIVTKLVSFYDFTYANPKAFAKAFFTTS